MDKLQDIYNTIASDFAISRHKPWPELNLFIPYIKNGFKLLDLGCGSGRLLNLFRENNLTIDYLGIDFSPALIKEAQATYPEQKFVCANMLEYSLESECYDAIFLIASFHHLTEVKQRKELLVKIFTALKPGGYLLMTNWNLWQLKYFQYLFKNIKQKKACNDFFIPWKNKNAQNKELYRFYHGFISLELKNLLMQAGFSLESNWLSKTNHNFVTISRRPL